MKENTFEFLYKELGAIAENFPQVHIKCGYDRVIETHIVELLPLSEYQNNTALDDAWIPLSIRFMETFAQDDISFISSGSTLNIDNVLFEFNVHSGSEENIISELYSSYTEVTMNYTFSNIALAGEILPNSTSVFSIKTSLERTSIDLANCGPLDTYSAAA